MKKWMERRGEVLSGYAPDLPNIQLRFSEGLSLFEFTR